MTQRVCVADGCESRHYGLGFCRKHYRRLKSTGSTELVQVSASEKFSRSHTEGPGCHEWTRGKTGAGYGLIYVDGRNQLAHRWAYEHFHGPIPEGLYVDHECGNPACVNPGHLRLATHKQNQENLTPRRANSSTGFRGVSEYKPGLFRARVTHNGVEHARFGFRSPESAERVAAEMRSELFTHSSEGKRTKRM